MGILSNLKSVRKIPKTHQRFIRYRIISSGTEAREERTPANPSRIDFWMMNGALMAMAEYSTIILHYAGWEFDYVQIRLISSATWKYYCVFRVRGWSHHKIRHQTQRHTSSRRKIWSWLLASKARQIDSYWTRPVLLLALISVNHRSPWYPINISGN